MTKCSVTGCVSGSFSDLRKTQAAGERPKSLFSVPKSPILLKKWQESLQTKDQTFSSKSKVCEMHFDDADVIKFDEILLKDGTINRIPRVKYKLRSEAVPTVLNNDRNVLVIPKAEASQQENIQMQQVADDKDNGSVVKALIMTTEPIEYADVKQEEFIVPEEKFLDNCSVLIDNYTFVELERDLIHHHLNMGPGWSYIFKESSVTFAYIHPLKLAIHLFCVIDQNMNVQIVTSNRQVTLHVDVKFHNRADVLKYLDGISKLKCCEGTGIENSYSKNCRGFILHADQYERSRGYQRCNLCRQFRRITLLRKQNLDNAKARLQNKQRRIKPRRCTNTHPQKKTEKQDMKIARMMDRL